MPWEEHVFGLEMNRPFKEETISFVLVLYSVHLQHATPPPLGAVTLRCAQLFAVAPLF